MANARYPIQTQFDSLFFNYYCCCWFFVGGGGGFFTYFVE